MDEQCVTLAIIDRINKAFPEQKAAINFLMELLSITYEAAYRRMKAKIPFRLNEVIAIANHLNCSVDSMLSLPSALPPSIKNDPMELYINRLHKEIEFTKRMCSAKDIKINIALNRIPFRYFIYPNLSRLEYFMWLHRHRLIFHDQFFSDIVIPDEIQSLHKECAYYVRQLRNVTCCVNDLTFGSIIQDITYYRQMQKISNQDLSKLLEELTDIYNCFQIHLHNSDKKFLFDGMFYYTQLPIHVNSLSAKYDDGFLIAFWLYDSIPVISPNDFELFDMHRDWFNGQMFVSQLISNTNSLMQSQSLLQMKECLKTIQNMIL